MYLFDNSLISKLRSILSDNRVSIITADKAFTKAGSIDDDVALPLVTVWRPSYNLIQFQRSTPGIYRGEPVRNYQGSSGETMFDMLQYLPIHINYQLDVFTRTRQENDELTRELLWYFTLYPQLSLTIPYGLDMPITWNLFFSDDVTDNSQIAEFESSGQYYRTTLNCYTDEGKLYLVNTVVGDSVIAEVEVSIESNKTSQEE